MFPWNALPGLALPSLPAMENVCAECEALQDGAEREINLGVNVVGG